MQNSTSQHFSTAVVILGAGASRRMGACKLLLDWGGQTVAAHWRSVWRQLHAGQITLVVRPNSELKLALPQLNWPAQDCIENPHPELGMFESIRCAACWQGWSQPWTHFVICLGDQPHLQLETLQSLLTFAAAHPNHICQPLWQGHRRHPVILPRHFFLELPLAPETSLKTFLDTWENSRSCFHATDPGLALDMDTPEQYQAAREFASLPPFPFPNSRPN